MKRGHFETHLKVKYNAHINSNLNYFQTLKKFKEREREREREKREREKREKREERREKREKREREGNNFHNTTANPTLEANCHISLLTRSRKSTTIEKNPIKPSISVFLKRGLEKDDKDFNVVSLSNITVCRRRDEISEDIDMQLVEKLKPRKCLVQLDKRQSEAVLITHIRYVDKSNFAKEMLSVNH
ncbi:SCAN domain-containing protein 3 [Trichonephila clavipes]|nr:SCAN domain-containing protein 3 [Trichonephila clavipes]